MLPFVPLVRASYASLAFDTTRVHESVAAGTGPGEINRALKVHDRRAAGEGLAESIKF
jgi:hypothetical protein